MAGVHCDQEEENLNTAAQALLFGDNQQADAINGDLQQKFHRTVTAVENCSDADCLFAAFLQQLAHLPPTYTTNELRWQVIH